MITNIFKSTAAKVAIVGFMAFGLVIGGASKADAITQSEANAIITALNLSGSQAASIQALVSGGSTMTTSYDFGSATLRTGSSGQYVMNLQSFLNQVSNAGLTVDGAYGPATANAVRSWQATQGLSADGVFGPNSMAKAGTMGSNSTTTTTTPAGCTAGAMFSSVTGQPCTTTTTTTTTTLSGGAGAVASVDSLSQYSSEEVGEGEDDVEVLGFEVEADNGSDLAITSMRLEFVESGSDSSEDLTDYADSISIWFNGDKVGEVDADEFSESSDVYTKNVTLSGVVIEADETAEFVIAVSALGNIDSGDHDSDAWTVDVLNFRFQDAMGAILTYDTDAEEIQKTFDFGSFADTADIELKVALGNSSPDAMTVSVDDSSDTDNVELLQFTIEAEGTDIMINDLPVYLTVSGASDVDFVTNSLILKADGKTWRESVSTSSASTTAIITFDDIDFEIEEGDKVTFTVLADINDTDSDFTAGNTLKAELTSTQVDAIDADDQEGDAISDTDATGSAIGDVMTFRVNGVNVVMGDATYTNTTDTNGLITSVTYTIPVEVTSFGETLYIGQSAQLATDVSASNAFSLVVETAAAPTTGTASATTSITLSTSNATIESNGFRLDEDQTKDFTIQVHMTAGTDNTSHRFRLDEVQTFTEAGLVTGTDSDLLPTEDYRTDFRYINN